ncbi:MAG: ABC transporter permease, partial [Deltaproteobacteria bacterium]|nr:ABC transporter permease [Deltaproteobacteria bacterium]
MGTFIARRLAQTVVVLFLLSLLVFMLINILPGDPVVMMLGADAYPEDIEALRVQLGLDQPMLVQYGSWLFDVLQGDLGTSIMYDQNVADLIAIRLPITFYVGVMAIIVAAVVGIVAGIICAVRRGSFLDQGITVLANTGISVPIFWLGILGIYAFGLKLGWLPVQGFTSPFEDFWLSIKKMIMPVICLSVVPLAAIARQSRSAMLEVIHQDYIRTALSKGLTERAIIIKHALKNALIPIVTLIGLQTRHVVGGSVLIETVFNIPGMGRLLVSSIFDKDFVIVQAAVLVIGIAVCLVNLIIDISYGYIDPR